LGPSHPRRHHPDHGPAWSIQGPPPRRLSHQEAAPLP
jgi:hypothetical protein